VLLAALALLAAAAPPDGVDLDDLDTWEARAARALDGPAGCWVLEGELAVAYTSWSAPSLFRRAEPEESRSTGTFTGKLLDGQWTSFEYTLSRRSGAGTELDLDVWPLVGRIDPEVPVRTGPEREAKSSVAVSSDPDEAMNLLHRAIELIDPSTSTAYAEWREDDRGVRLMQDVPMSDGARADTLAVSTFFPGGGPLPTEVDVRFPRKIRVSQGLLRATIYDAQMHSRSHVLGERLVPAKESVSLGIGALGFTLGYEQQLTYRRATACGE
jgi:hypothetical protein